MLSFLKILWGIQYSLPFHLVYSNFIGTVESSEATVLYSVRHFMPMQTHTNKPPSSQYFIFHVGALTAFSWKCFASPASRGYESDRIIRSTYQFAVSLSVLFFTFPLLHYLVCLILAGDMDYNWLDHTSWHSSEASPMSLVRHVEPYHLVSFIISHFLCFIYTFACFLFCVLFLSHS